MFSSSEPEPHLQKKENFGQKLGRNLTKENWTRKNTVKGGFSLVNFQENLCQFAKSACIRVPFLFCITFMNKHLIVIGAGIGGLGVAGLFAKKGYQVTVLEKNANFGGRANIFEAEGFKYD